MLDLKKVMSYWVVFLLLKRPCQYPIIDISAQCGWGVAGVEKTDLGRL